MFTVKQLSKLAGVTPRTLHHYDEIGLLKPSRVGENGYRYYGEEAVLQLQQILFYRELGMPLEDIKKIMGRRDFDVLGALHSHREALQKQVIRLNRLITTVDNTINHLKGTTIMSDKGLFEGFSEEQQEQYAAEAEQMYDPEIVRESNRKWKAYSPAKKESIMAEGKSIYTDMIAAMSKGADSPEVQANVERWRKHMDYFWTPTLDQLQALANGYNDDPRFKANFDKMHPQLAEFMREAVKVYVTNQKKRMRVKMTEEIYPMPSFPTLIVNDVEASSDFYQNALGFKHIFTMPGPDGKPSLVHLRWVKYADLLITRPRDGKALTGQKGVGISLNFNMLEHFDGDMDAFAKYAREHDAHVTGPIDQPWNVREVSVFDPDGYKLIFTMPINLNLSFDEVIERVKNDESK